MLRTTFSKMLLQLAVVLAGVYFLWNFNFFLPYAIHYKPEKTYETLGPDTVKAAPGLQYQRNAIGRFWLGEHKRTVWTTPVKVPVLDLNKLQLKIRKKGGGMQTTSFTLTGPDGKVYSLRSIDKDPVGVLPPFLWKTAVASFVRDQITATDPFAWQVVYALGQKAGVLHAKPEMYFALPGDPALAAYGQHAGGFYNLSPKITDETALQQPGEDFSGILEWEELVKVLAENKTTVSIDTTLYLKCRLFDLLIGDWDRHQGQWDWAAFSTESHTVFRPLPKDRDQALGFYQDGVLPYLLTRKFLVRKIKSLTPEFEDLEGFTINGRVLDDLFLQHIPVSRFEAEARKLQQLLPDEVIGNALNQYPPEVPEKMRNLTFEALKSRRDNLVHGATMFYEATRERNTGK